MRIFLTGASGFIGGALIRGLAAEGHAISALVRRPAPAPPLRGCRLVQGDLAAEGGLEAARDALAEADLVAHVAAQRKDWGMSTDALFRVNVASGPALLSMATHAKRFLFVSSVGVHGHSTGRSIDETSPMLPYDRYGQSKVDAERALRDAAATLGVPLTIVRPGIVYGPGDTYGMVTKMARLIARRRFMLVGDGMNRVHLLHVEDLATALARALTAPGAEDDTFLLAGTEAVTMTQLAGLVAREVGRRPPPHVPVGWVRTAADVMERIYRILGATHEPFVTHAKATLLTCDYLYDTTRARERLGFAPRTGIEAGIRQTVDWCRRQELL